MTAKEIHDLAVQHIRKFGMIGADADTAIQMGVSEEQLKEIILDAMDEALT